MRLFITLTLSILFSSCQLNNKSKSYVSNSEEIVASIDKSISEKDTYKYMGHLRYPSYSFARTDFPTFDSVKFKYSLVAAHYDTLNRQITRIGVLSYKVVNSAPSRTDDFYFDENERLVKIQVLTHDTSPQNFASYYFQNGKLIYETTKDIEIENLSSYLPKIYNIYAKVSRELKARNLIASTTANTGGCCTTQF